MLSHAALPSSLSGRRTSRARDYDRIARAIDYLRRQFTTQPDLAAVASHVHLSEYHFQRLFTRWAGVSPKRFQQFLTVEHAKARLSHSRSVIELAGEAGLSGPGRLHDLFVTLEAVSPGEFKAGGAGLAIRYAIHDTPFGPALIAVTPRGICALQFVENARGAVARLRHDWPHAGLQEDSSGIAHLAKRIFEPIGSRPPQSLALLVKGTNFQLQVWRALLGLPFGSLTTYGTIAAGIGQPSAARAVGNAVASNPIAYLIPCHRVIRESAEFGNYRWGIDRKIAILGWEAARSAE